MSVVQTDMNNNFLILRKVSGFSKFFYTVPKLTSRMAQNTLNAGEQKEQDPDTTGAIIFPLSWQVLSGR